MKAPSAELSSKIHGYVKRHRGRLYAPVPHPAFADIPCTHGPERFDLIAPHLGFRNGTVLDIGSNFGYIAHRLEDLGYRVTAVERSDFKAGCLAAIRDLCDRKFEVVHDSIFNVEKLEYDIVIALNIFHHFMRTKETYEQLDAFLKRLKCRMMIYQAHDPAEVPMKGAYRNMTPEEATGFLSERLSLPCVVEIGSYRKTRRVLNVIPRVFDLPSYQSSERNRSLAQRAFELACYRKDRKIFKLSE